MYQSKGIAKQEAYVERSPPPFFSSIGLLALGSISSRLSLRLACMGRHSLQISGVMSMNHALMRQVNSNGLQRISENCVFARVVSGKAHKTLYHSKSRAVLYSLEFCPSTSMEKVVLVQIAKYDPHLPSTFLAWRYWKTETDPVG